MKRIVSDKILLVVVLYNQRLDECNVFKTFIKYNIEAMDGLLVYDNSENSHREKIDVPNGVFEYVCNMCNTGLSYNYNRAARYAKENGYGWLLLLDQDTSFPSNAFYKYKESVVKLRDYNLFAPKHRLTGGGLLSPYSIFKGMLNDFPTGECNLKKYDIINSGMLVNVDSFINVGGYKDDVSLDFSDFQFIERYKEYFTKAFVLDVECVQDFSNDESNVSKLLSRYSMYCDSFLNFEYHFNRTRIKLLYLVAKHTIALCVRCKSVTPFLMLFNKMMKK